MILLCVVATDRPKIKDLLAIGVVQEVSSACTTKGTRIWKDLGFKLSLDESDLDIIVDNHHDIVCRCTSMFTLWLEKKPNASWEELKKALVAVKLGQIASTITQAITDSEESSPDVPVQAPVGITDGCVTSKSKTTLKSFSISMVTNLSCLYC